MMSNEIIAFLAANAPNEIPGWFVHRGLEAPKPPQQPNQIKWGSKEDEEVIEDWCRDSCYDLPDHLGWYQDAWHEYYEKRNLWRNEDQISRYFQWRIFYAETLAAELNKER